MSVAYVLTPDTWGQCDLLTNTLFLCAVPTCTLYIESTTVISDNDKINEDCITVCYKELMSTAKQFEEASNCTN